MTPKEALIIRKFLDRLLGMINALFIELLILEDHDNDSGDQTKKR